mgnify:CR=1 FL=1
MIWERGLLVGQGKGEAVFGVVDAEEDLEAAVHAHSESARRSVARQTQLRIPQTRLFNIQNNVFF